ncbi:mitogen-activated protein kinase phosphatase 1 [Actinidia rufa]|uniref:Mitogen-activated protein kinase phosphatase 1 n=1 Tax=Actinidia rufa TaxID=165716 RepID=A0A7J0EYE2_9ERIC|nr:mitogen-activated protein kinase phosphatase 1 [Actinidia rufa]
MLGEEQEEDQPSGGGGGRENVFRSLRSASWSDRSPRTPNPRPQSHNKARLCLPPLQPLSISGGVLRNGLGQGLMILVYGPKPRPRVHSISRMSLCTRLFGCGTAPQRTLRVCSMMCLITLKIFERQGGQVFVHCCQGVARSASLVIAYLMWRERQAFEDAFKYVKAARALTNPNMGFACQLLQCQNQTLAAVTSPNYVLRMYHLAPHSPYDPLHLVPKLLNQAGAQGLDSRRAFVIHVSSAIYVWIGKSCVSVMADKARVVAFQVIRYEMALGLVVTIEEGEESPEFWDALMNGQFFVDGSGEVKTKKEERLSAGNGKFSAANCPGIGQKKVDMYDMDLEVFHKALAGGVVPPFPLSGTEFETSLPTIGIGWGRLTFASGITKELIVSSKLSCETTQSDYTEFPVDPSSPSTFKSGFLDYVFSPISSPIRIDDTCKEISPSGLQSPNPYPANNVSQAETACLVSKGTSPSLTKAFSDNHALKEANICLPCKKTTPSIAERRGSNPPPRMMLPTVGEPSQVPRCLVKSWSFSVPILEEDVMRDVKGSQEYDTFRLPSSDTTSKVAEAESMGDIFGCNFLKQMGWPLNPLYW